MPREQEKGARAEAGSVVYKYPLPQGFGAFSVEMPLGATVLSAAVEGDRIVVWAHVDPTASKAPRAIYVFATGAEFDDRIVGRFIATLCVWGEPRIIAHVFDGVGSDG